jgi:hypothetical protein
MRVKRVREAGEACLRPARGARQAADLVEHLCDRGGVNYGVPAPRIRETATFVAATETGGERPVYRLLLGELPGGRGYIYAMELPWGDHEREVTFDTLAEACDAADQVYRLWPDAGVWQVRRPGWERPQAP